MSYFDSIYADTLLPPRAVSVYMYLKDRSNSAGSCWPGIKTIARDIFVFFLLKTVTPPHIQLLP